MYNERFGFCFLFVIVAISICGKYNMKAGDVPFSRHENLSSGSSIYPLLPVEVIIDIHMVHSIDIAIE